MLKDNNKKLPYTKELLNLKYKFRDKNKEFKLIAEFMDEWSYLRVYKYDYSWDALKPVINKIVSLALNSSDKGKLILMSDYYRDIADFSVIAQIEPVYNKVVEFIKWYTTLKD